MSNEFAAISPRIEQFSIAFHCSFGVIHRLANIVGKSMSAMLFLQMVLSAIEMASFLSAVDETKGISPSNNIAVLRALTVVMPTFHFCMQSDNITGHLEMVGDDFYGCSWRRFSVRQQMLILLSVQRAQKQFRINGLGIVDCSLETFSVVKSLDHHML